MIYLIIIISTVALVILIPVALLAFFLIGYFAETVGEAQERNAALPFPVILGSKVFAKLRKTEFLGIKYIVEPESNRAFFI